MALLVLLGFGIFSFIAASNKQDDVFTWLLSLTGLSAMFTWFGISLAHIRFRHALKAHNRGPDELWFSAPTGLWGSYYSCGMIGLIIVLDFWTSLWPYDSSPNAEYFFEDYLSAPVFILMYLGHKLFTKNWKLFIPSKNVDIVTGRRVTDVEALKAEVAEEKAYLASKPRYFRIYKFFC